MSTTDHIHWDGGHIELADGTTIRWTARINQDVKDCKIDGPIWKGTLTISGEEEMKAGSFEAAVRRKLKFLTTRGDPRLQWQLNPPQPQPVTFWLVKNTSDETLTYQNEKLEHVEIGPGETVRYDLPSKPVAIFYENNDPTPPKTYKRIDKIAKY